MNVTIVAVGVPPEDMEQIFRLSILKALGRSGTKLDMDAAEKQWNT